MKYYLSILLSLYLSVSTAQTKVSYIKIQRTACFGICPEYSVEFFKNGNIIYTGKKNVDRIGEYHGKISNKTMTKFLSGLSKYKLSSLQPIYKSKVTDIARLNLTFVINGKTKSVKNGESGPAYLSTIGDKMDSLLHFVKWEEIITPDHDKANGPVLNIEVDHGKNMHIFNEKEPEFPGGMEALMSFLQNNIRYPELAKSKGIEGKVICGFVINKSGKIEDVKIQKGLGYGCDEEAMRVISLMPDWRPGFQNDKAVNVKYNIPISFRLK